MLLADSIGCLYEGKGLDFEQTLNLVSMWKMMRGLFGQKQRTELAVMRKTEPHNWPKGRNSQPTKKVIFDLFKQLKKVSETVEMCSVKRPPSIFQVKHFENCQRSNNRCISFFTNYRFVIFPLWHLRLHLFKWNVKDYLPRCNGSEVK